MTLLIYPPRMVIVLRLRTSKGCIIKHIKHGRLTLFKDTEIEVISIDIKKKKKNIVILDTPKLGTPKWHDFNTQLNIVWVSRQGVVYNARRKRSLSYWKWPIEIVDLPIKAGDFLSFFVCLPEGIFIKCKTVRTLFLSALFMLYSAWNMENRGGTVKQWFIAGRKA